MASQPKRYLDQVPDRKQFPMVTGLLDYFPDALAYVAYVSKCGNDQHNPGQPLHWSFDKSTDHADTAARHLTQRGYPDTDGVLHSGKAAWRALANLQVELMELLGLDLPRAAKVTPSAQQGKGQVLTKPDPEEAEMDFYNGMLKIKPCAPCPLPADVRFEP